MGWLEQLRDFVQVAHPLSEREVIDLAAQKFKSMIADIDIVQAQMEELRDTLQGAIDDALRYKDLQ